MSSFSLHDSNRWGIVGYARASDAVQRSLRWNLGRVYPWLAGSQGLAYLVQRSWKSRSDERCGLA